MRGHETPGSETKDFITHPMGSSRSSIQELVLCPMFHGGDADGPRRIPAHTLCYRKGPLTPLMGSEHSLDILSVAPKAVSYTNFFKIIIQNERQ